MHKNSRAMANAERGAEGVFAVVVIGVVGLGELGNVGGMIGCRLMVMSGAGSNRQHQNVKSQQE